MKASKQNARQRRHKRIQYKITTTTNRHRLNVYRGLKNLFAQIIDDNKKTIVLSCSTFDKEFKNNHKYGGNIKAATALGVIMAEKAKKSGITTVVFDRGGYQYHGRVKAFAEAARKAGLNF